MVSGDENYNMLVHSTMNDSTVTWPNSPSSTFLFRNLIKNKTLKSLFVSRYAEVLNTHFNSDEMMSKLDSIKEIYNPEIGSHIGRWNYPDSFNEWEEDIENELSYFIENRPCIVREHIMTFFNLTDFVFNCDSSIVESKIGDLILAPNPNNGNFSLLNTYSDITNATIIITNINGQIVYKENNTNLMKTK